MGVQPCPIFGLHQMRPGAKAIIWNSDGTVNLTNKYGLSYHSVCECGEKFICSGQPQYNPPSQIGWWVAGNLQPSGGMGGALTYRVPESSLKYTTDVRMEGYRFLI
ncbi:MULTISPECIES: hypothetical protein [Sporosarcina]|uniref:Uncharacterized protein n=1 Tax=Sporosarcina contaminans TaxID=633403 RepID=A0ABW3TXH6_9BACL